MADRRDPAPAERTYTVKTGDNLWKIAKEQCKDIAQVDELKKLNAGVAEEWRGPESWNEAPSAAQKE